MIEDENMRIANRITVLRAKKEYQMIKQARQQKQQQAKLQQQQKAKKIIEQIEAENKVNKEIKRQRYRSVMCITTGETFNTIKEAAEKYHVHATNISQCCRGTLNHAGRLQDGTQLEWRYINSKQN